MADITAVTAKDALTSARKALAAHDAVRAAMAVVSAEIRAQPSAQPQPQPQAAQ